MDRSTIKQVGGSLYFRIPSYFWRKHNIKAGDPYDMIVNADGSIIKFIKADDQPVREEATEAAE